MVKFGWCQQLQQQRGAIEAQIGQAQSDRDMMAGASQATRIEGYFAKELAKLTGPMLKDLLRAEGLAVSGRKAELIDIKGCGTHKDVACRKLSHTGLLGKTDALRELAMQRLIQRICELEGEEILMLQSLLGHPHALESLRASSCFRDV